MNKPFIHRQCVNFDNHGPLGLGTCKITGYVFYGKHDVDQCAKFSKKARKKRLIKESA